MSSVLALVRRLAQLPGITRLSRVDAVTRVSFALRGSLVRESARFALNELRARPLATYHLRGSGISIALRHRTPDVLVLDEIFSQREYELPRPVHDVLEPLAELRVVDVGANIGLFGAFVLSRFPEASIVGVEADDANAEVHELTIRANAREDTWRLIRAFAASEARDVRFTAGEFSTSRAGGETVVQAIDVFPLLAEADLVKIDIEGAEWELLADPRFGDLHARAVALEYHVDGCPQEDPGAAAEEYLRRAGFDVHEQTRKPRCGAGLVWAVR